MSTRVRYRGALACLLGVVALVCAMGVSTLVGASNVGIDDVAQAFSSFSFDLESLSVKARIVRELRFPRVLGGCLVGGTLAVVGVTLQSVLTNPMADPYVLGISSGASVGAAFAFVVGADAFGGASVSTFAFVAAAVTILVVLRVARSREGTSPLRLLLAGIAVSSFATALTSFLLHIAPEAMAVRTLVFWLMGGFASSDWRGLAFASLFALPTVALLIASARAQNLLLLGDETAASLGLDVERTRMQLTILASLATGTVVAFAGAIGFVGLVVPHALRLLLGSDSRRLLPNAFVWGAVFLVAMDAVARVALAPEELPVGILTGVLGGPFFLVLLSRVRGDRRG